MLSVIEGKCLVILRKVGNFNNYHFHCGPLQYDLLCFVPQDISFPY